MSHDITGRGSPLILLHAFPFDRHFWKGTASRLASGAPGVQSIAPDLRGFGDATGTPTSIADMADDVAALMDTLGQSKAAVAGLSMGGYVALAFASKYPHRLSALILADTKAGADSPEARKARADAIALVESAGVAGYIDKQLPRLVAPSAGAEVRAEVRGLAIQQRPESVVAGLAALRDRPDRAPQLPAIACPTLIVVGAEDVLTPPAESRAMATAIKGARLVEIPGCGHLPSHEAKGAFTSALAGFLASL